MSNRDSDASRRAFLASLVALGSGALVRAKSPASQTQSATSRARRRIDVHSHIIPPSLARTMGAARLGMLAGWTPEKSLEDMDGAGVSTSMISIAPQGSPFDDPATAARVARDANDYSTRLAGDHPGRFGVFASLPLPDVAASLTEIAYALDTLKADGVAMFTSYGSKWLGDPIFDPVFEELNRRKAVVYTHPTSATCCANLVPGIADFAIEWGTDTTRAIARMVFGGAAARYPHVRMIFSHAGGTMPFLVERFTILSKAPPYATQLPEGFVKAASRFYYDTAQTANPAAMAALSRVVPRSQIVFGTDFPFRTAAEHVKGLAACGVFTPANLQAIDGPNALALLRKR